MTPDPDLPLVSTSVDLSTRYWLAEAVHTDGHVEFWIIDQKHPEAVTVQFPEHERTGKLPTKYRRRLGLECGAKTSTGHRCHTIVTTRGARCGRHRKITDGQEALFT